MRAIRTSGLMSGDGKRGGASASVLAPILDSTKYAGSRQMTRHSGRAALRVNIGDYFGQSAAGVIDVVARPRPLATGFERSADPRPTSGLPTNRPANR